MPAIPAEVQIFIVQELAMYAGPVDVVDRVKEEFGLVVSKQAVQHYHPDTHAGRNLAKKWRDLFAKTRKDFNKGKLAIPIAQKHYRLRELGHMAITARRRGAVALAADLLAQAAKEVGDAYTNKLRVAGVKGQPVEFQHQSDDDLMRAFLAIVGGKAGDEDDAAEPDGG